LVDFVEEVEERLRAERYATLTRRCLPWLFAALAALVIGWLGVWGYQSWQDRNIGAASVSYDSALEALAKGDQTGAQADLDGVAKNGPPAYRSLALMMQANLRLSSGDPDEAASLYDAAAKAAPNDILKDLASLRAAQTVMDTAPYPQVETRLKALIGDKRPFTLDAREMLAMAKLQAGRIQDARGDYSALSLTLGVSQAMRARAQNAIALIDSGQAGLVGQVVRAAATLPPPTSGNVAILPGAQAPDGGAADQAAPPADSSDQNPAGNPQ